SALLSVLPVSAATTRCKGQVCPRSADNVLGSQRAPLWDTMTAVTTWWSKSWSSTDEVGLFRKGEGLRDRRERRNITIRHSEPLVSIQPGVRARHWSSIPNRQSIVHKPHFIPEEQ